MHDKDLLLLQLAIERGYAEPEKLEEVLHRSSSEGDFDTPSLREISDPVPCMDVHDVGP